MYTYITGVKRNYADRPISGVISKASQSIHPSVPSITHLLSHILAALQVVVAIWEDLRLHDGHDAMLAGGAEQPVS